MCVRALKKKSASFPLIRQSSSKQPPRAPSSRSRAHKRGLAMKFAGGWLALFAAVGAVAFTDAHATDGSSGNAGSCHAKALVAAGHARFCVLTSRVIRMEWATAAASFRDDTTMMVQNRLMDQVPDFNVSKDGGKVVIMTQHLRLEYDANSKESFNDDNLKVQLLQGGSYSIEGDEDTRKWMPSMTDQVRQDALPGTIRTLDGANGAIPLDCQNQGPDYIRDKHCTYGIISKKRGYTVLDDSLNAAFDQDPQWAWLKKPVTSQSVDPATCSSVSGTKRRVCGLETKTPEDCAAKGCCFSNSTEFGVLPTQAEPFRCFYSVASYQDLYFFGHGHDFKGALREFTMLSGSIPIPPRFAFGVFYSRWWAYSDADLQQDIVGQYEDRGLPLDVVVIDMDWHLTFYKSHESDQAGQQKGWTGFTWDKNLFPDPKQFLTWLHEKGIAVTLNLHPASGVQPWEDTYEEMAKAMGIDPTTKKYVPFRITDKKFAETWLNISIGARESDGVDFWWLDWQQGEDWIERTEGRNDINPTIWLNYVFFTNPHHWGLTQSRPMLLHRFGGIGNHRYPVGFSGDVFASWDSLRFQPYFTAMAANLAYGYWSHDLGGFQNPPEAELFTRWIQWGAFAPIFRTHSSKDAASDRRIWKYADEFYEITRAAMEIRASLIPYVYSEAWTAHTEGLAVLHGAYIDYPEHDEAYSFTQQYMYGSQMLVSPVVEPVAKDTQLSPKSIWVPPGAWYDFNTGNVLTGPIVYSYSYALNEIPRFAKAGSIIPTAEHEASGGTSSVGQNTHLPKKLHLLVVPGAPKHFYELHEDDGLTKEYLSGHKSSTLFDFTSSCGAHAASSKRHESVFRFDAKNLLQASSSPTFSYCSGGQAEFNIMPVKGSFASMPTKRSYKIEFLSALPAASVTVNGQGINFIEFPDTAQRGQDDGFSYSGKTLSLIVHLNAPRDVKAPIKVVVQFITTPSTFNPATLLSEGFVGKFARLHAVKVLLDNQWAKDTVYMSDYPQLLAATEVDRKISYNPSALASLLTGFDALLAAGVKEVASLKDLHPEVRTQALAFLSTKSYQTKKVKYVAKPNYLSFETGARTPSDVPVPSASQRKRLVSINSSMASKYAKALQVPAEFPDLLRNFTREVLRQQGKMETKEAIYEFGAQFFRDLVQKRDGNGAKPAGAAVAAGAVAAYMKASEEEIHEILARAFQGADQQGVGMLAYDDFHKVLLQIGETLQLSPIELKALFAEANENDQGAVSYSDFLPTALQIVLHLRSTKPQRHARLELFGKKETEAFLHGMMQDDVESLLREIFQRADADEKGILPRIEFMDALLDADLGFTRREVNILMSEAPSAAENSGEILYQDFIPLCFPVLRDVFVQDVVEMPNDQDSLAQYLVEVFASGDSEATGLLTVAELTRLFRAADVGLTRLQIITVMCEAQEDKSGFVNYEKFAAHVAGMVLVLVSFDSQQTFAAYLQKYRKTSEYYTVLDMNQHSFEQSLSHALEALDEGHRGLLVREDVVSAIQNTFPDVSQRQLRSLLALADVDEMGELEYNLITHSAFQALQKLQEYDMMIMES